MTTIAIYPTIAQATRAQMLQRDTWLTRLLALNQQRGGEGEGNDPQG